MNLFTKTATVAGLAALVTAGAMAQSEARPRGAGVGLGIGLAAGAIAGAAIASGAGRGYYYDEPVGYYGGPAPGYRSYGYAPGYDAYGSAYYDEPRTYYRPRGNYDRRQQQGAGGTGTAEY